MSSVARKRWKLLGEILLNHKIDSKDELAQVSVRRFSSFQLFHTEKTIPAECSPENKKSTVNGTGYRNGVKSNGTNGSYILSSNGKINQMEGSKTNGKVLNHEEKSEIEKDINNTEINCQNLQVSKSSQNADEQHIWFKYTSEHFPYLSINIRHLSTSLSIDNLLGFNNTGNVCVWPSEEILAYYCLKHLEWFRTTVLSTSSDNTMIIKGFREAFNYHYVIRNGTQNRGSVHVKKLISRLKSVCELGGGMTCLALMMMASCIELESALATDGNEQSISNLEEIVRQNQCRFTTKDVCASVLRWDDEQALYALEKRFDFIICADCLFFDEYRQSLLSAISKLLKPQGRAILFAPSRDRTFNKFLSLVDQSEAVRLVQSTDLYDDLITSMHRQNLKLGVEFYDENLHYPKLIELIKL